MRLKHLHFSGAHLICTLSAMPSALIIDRPYNLIHQNLFDKGESSLNSSYNSSTTVLQRVNYEKGCCNLLSSLPNSREFGVARGPLISEGLNHLYI